ncbi:MAG: restriction endonuclease [Thermoanaerobaculia bacterium]
MHVVLDPAPAIVREESEIVEFKLALPSERELHRVLSDFAGANGGLLVIGADDSGRIVGFPREDTLATRERLSAAVEMLPFEGAWHVGSQQIGGRAVAFVEVQPGSDSDEYLADDLTSAFERVLRSRRSSPSSPPSPAVQVELIPFGEVLAAKLRDDPAVIHNLNADEFEQFICERLFAMGFEPKRVGRYNQRDGGIDVLFWPRVWRNFPFLGAAQVKHHKPSRNVGPPAVREFAAVIANHPINAGLIVTNTSFTPDARWFAQERAKLLRLRGFEDIKRWIADDFASDQEWRDIPASIELAPGLIIKLKP